MDGRILNVFRFGVIQDCLNIKLKLDEYNIPWEEFEEWVKEMAKTYRPISPPSNPQPLIPNPPPQVLKRACPECGKWVRIFRVNHKPNVMVGGDFKSQWRCSCGWEEFTSNEVMDEAKPYMEDLKVVYLPTNPRDTISARRRAAQKPCSKGGGK